MCKEQEKLASTELDDALPDVVVNGSTTNAENGEATMTADAISKFEEPQESAVLKPTGITERGRQAMSFWRNLCGRTPQIESAREMGVWEKSLEDRSGFMSSWLLDYLSPLLRLGATKVLDADDMGVPSQEDGADRAYEVALNAWTAQTAKAEVINAKRQASYQAALAKCKTDEQRKKVKTPALYEPSIATALVVGFGGWKLTVGILYYVIGAVLAFVPVLILSDLVKFFESNVSIKEYDGYANPWVEVVGLAVVPFVVSLLQTRHQVIMSHCAVFVRTAVSTLLYRKALRVSAAGRAKTSTGQVVNIMSNDTAQLQRFLQFAGFVFVAPLQIIIALILIFMQVGNATWVGVGFMVFLAPINMVIFSIISKQRRTVLKFSDMRVKMMNEILTGIRIIKFYAWERPFSKEVGNIRGHELEALTKLSYTVAIGFSLILLAAPLIQPILVFLTYVSIQSTPLSASTAFTTVALFNIMRFPFAFLPMGLLQYIQSKISLRRLERYLDLPELPEYVSSSPPPDAKPGSPEMLHGSVTIKSGTFSWVDPDGKPIRPVQDELPKKERKSRRSRSRTDGESTDIDMKASAHSVASSAGTEGGPKGPVITLQNLDLHIEAGSLVVVVGPVGSGKSSLLSAMLGELEPINGSKVYIPKPSGDQVGYVSYASQTPWVVNDTLRGNILFGRPYDEERYNQVVESCALLADIEVLPAGDLTEIGERGINLSGGQKARVSLARALYSRNTKVVLMDDPLSAVDSHVGEHIFSHAIAGDLGRGVTRILVTHHVHLLARCAKVIVMEQGRIKHQGSYTALVEQGVDFAGAIDVSRTKTSKQEDAETSSTAPGEVKKDEVGPEENKVALMKSGKKLVSDEEREEGKVAGSAYIHYARSGGLWMASAALIVQGIGRASEIMSGFWLALWAQRTVSASNRGEPFSQRKTNLYLGIYAVFGMIGVFGLVLRSLAIAVHRLGASRTLHNDLVESILRAPVSFYDITPTGRILNRFAADMDKVDLELTQSLSQAMSTLFNVLGAIGAIIAATKGTFLVPLVPLGYFYYLVQDWFRKSSTELQRINSIANSPIFADFSQTLTGTATIRAYGEQQRFFTQCKASFDNMNTSYILVQLVGLWLGLRLDLLGGLMGSFIGGLALATRSSGFIPAGWVGLALSNSIEVTNFLKLGVRMIATVEAQMNSVERILYYTNNITPEAPEFIKEKDPEPGKWPKEGGIELQHASMRYRDGPLVLKELSVKIQPGEKVGVCGRTGSGKSSLMVALFRISEIEDDGGVILIDDVNVREIGLAALRLNLSIIPQDPVIFSNTVRYNLDPFGNAADDELWAVLKKVQMDEVVAALPLGLAEMVAEGGENFSQGQRQLLCIARALLRKPKILVMDEATASIDNTTDAAIQEMIRENFHDATVLTIAHRLNTIMDSDRVLVLDQGRVAEFDSPERLLQKEDGIFKAMVDRSREANTSTIDEE